MKKLFLIFLLLIGINLTTKAQANDDWRTKAAEAMQKGNQKESLNWLIVGAENGDSFAQYSVAVYYLQGYGTAKDLKKVEYWASKSALQGDSHGQSLLGDLYFNEYNDNEKAIYWWEQAANQDDLHCIQNLGKLYLNGKNEIKKDIPKAFEWIRKAAFIGDADAQLLLGDVNYQGEFNFPVNYKEAFNWYNKAANQNNAEGLYKAGYMLAYNDDVPQDLKKGFEYLSKSAQLGFSAAYNDLAYFYAKGMYVPQNFSMAHEMVDEAINADPTSPEAVTYYDSKGEIYLMEGKQNEAIQIWNKIKRDFPQYMDYISDSNFVNSIKSITNEK